MLHFISRIRERCSKTDILFGLLLSSFALNILALVVPLVMLQTYDRIIPNESFGTLAMMILAIAITLILEICFKVLRSTISSWADSRYEHIASCTAYSHIMNANPAVYEKEGTGSLLDQINAVNQFKDFYTGQLLTTAIDVPFIVIFLGLMAYLAGVLVLIPIIILIVYMVYSMSSNEKMLEVVEEKQRAGDKVTNFVIQTLRKIHTLKAMGMEDQMLRRYERLQENNATIDYNMAVFSGKKTAMSQLVSQLNLVLIVSAGAYLVISGMMSVGALAACTFLSNRIMQPVGKLSGLWTRLQSVKLAEERLQHLKELPSEWREDQVDLTSYNGRLEIRNLSIQYPGADQPILHNINLSVEPGQYIGITGEGLTGKTSLLLSIQGMVDIAGGDILLDGQSLDKYVPHSVRQHIAYLSEEAVIYEGTLLENLTLFRNKDYVEKAYAVCKELKLDRYIHHLPKGYETILGNASADFLPRGIRQRIAIAQVLVTEPEVFLFDEANTALDLEADALLTKALGQRKGKFTMIFVSYRKSLLALADKKYELRNGELYDSGS